MANIFKSLRKRPVDWRKGSAEMIGFALVLPALCILLLLSVGIIQTGLMRQMVEYSTYTAARAAVTCDIEYGTQGGGVPEPVVEAARNAAKMTMQNSTFGIDADRIAVSVELVGGTSSAFGGGITWEKGALAKCTLTVPFQAASSFEEKDMTSTIYIMVERPARTYF